MNSFPIHTLDSAPTDAKPVLQTLKDTFGFIPNLAGAMAASPTLIKGFIGLFQLVHAGNFSEKEIQTVLLTDAIANRSTWAAAFHTALALQHGVDPADVQAIRDEQGPRDLRVAALSDLARNLIEQRGHTDPQVLERFYQAGYRSEHVLEAIAIVAASTITNYVGNLAHPPLEESLRQHQWKAGA